jgi:hypothetical protein
MTAGGDGTIVSRILTEQHISAHPQERFELSIVDWSRIPLRERVVDLLADLMLNADDILDMLAADAAGHELRWLEPNIREVYDNVNELMKSLCD